MQETNREDVDGLVLPISASRLRTMMKSSPQIECVSNESVMAMVKATELFIKELALLSKSEGKNEIDYDRLARVQSTMNRFAFLSDIIPEKITVKEWREKYEELFRSN